jgi:NCAIR mutase (PurE)-related protein
LRGLSNQLCKEINMDSDSLKKLASSFLEGVVSEADFLKSLPLEQAMAATADAHLDKDRARRCGFPEVIYGQGKSIEQISGVIDQLLLSEEPVLVTRVEESKGNTLAEKYPQGNYNETASTFRISARTGDEEKTTGKLAILTAGTTDLPVAMEAHETALWMGVDAELIVDIGVAGPQRLLSNLSKLSGMSAIIVVAGMEGALPSVVGGYVACPVIAVPTSVGYGASLQGLTPLLGMLNSCAANVTVVNIDAGFKGGYIGSLIVTQATA